MLVRTDIPLADQLVQVGHVCLESGNRFEQPTNPSHLVLLSVSSEQQLYDAVAKIELAGIRYEIFYEPDDDMRYTAACTEPISSKHRHIFRKFSIWCHIKSNS